jgi:dihydroorotate dehydrogenase electron transfer subunit
MMRIAGLQDPFLSRPLSVYAFSRSQKGCVIELLYRVAGRGTGIMAGLIEGSEVEIIGPLGQSYRVDPLMKNIVFIAGGIGVAPLSLLAGHLGDTFCRETSSMTFFLGARTAEEIVGIELLQKYCYRVIVCTDDGSMGEKGQVTGIFKKEMAKFPPADTALYACGPRPMLKALAGLVGGKYKCQVSLEERMACGVGACAGCVAAIKEGRGKMAYKRVCAEGPIFDLETVIWQ